MLALTADQIPTPIAEMYIAEVEKARPLPGGQELFDSLLDSPSGTIIILESRDPCSVAEEIVIMKVDQRKRQRLG